MNAELVIPDHTTERKGGMTSVVFAGSIGTIIEWYDFLIYGTYCGAGLQHPVLSHHRSAQRNIGVACDLFGRLRRTPDRRGGLWPLLRLQRPPRSADDYPYETCAL